MKVHLLLPLLIVVSVLVVGVIKMRKQEHDKDNRVDRFQAIKLRVTYDVLVDYQNEKSAKQVLLEKAESEYNTLMVEYKTLKTKGDTAKGKEDDCLTDKTSQKSVLDLVEKDFSDVKGNTEKESTGWKTEVETLQQQLAEWSKVCNFVKPGSQSSQLCGIEESLKPEEAKAEAPKAEAPKPEEAKAEAPKAEAPKPEEAKAEAPKAEAPKPEEAKAEAPKQEEAKAEAPKPEEAKAEAPKPEEAKAEAPKQEEAKAEAPKQEEAKAEAPKPEEAKAEAPKAEAPKPEEAKAEAPKVEAKAEAPKKR
ncbi:neurofilament heavy polypeptide-like [Labrus mixtus]|uniref:neurofilament heavy polypeptide-like n=1 Tax=Labrus mixtus TaxID=508554 RepID=UPI0029BFBE3A|nr:neurofilament heavy polypeptide-like [Labrus mixtus]